MALFPGPIPAGAKGLDWLEVLHASGTATVRATLREAAPWPPVRTSSSSDPCRSWIRRHSKGSLASSCSLLAPHTELDPVALLASFFAEVGTMLGRGPHLVLDGSDHPLLVWPVLVGRSSRSRKGTADSRIRRVCALVDPTWQRGACKGTLSSGEGLAYAVRDPEYRDEAVKRQGHITEETVTVCTAPGGKDK